MKSLLFLLVVLLASTQAFALDPSIPAKYNRCGYWATAPLTAPLVRLYHRLIATTYSSIHTEPTRAFQAARRDHEKFVRESYGSDVAERNYQKAAAERRNNSIFKANETYSNNALSRGIQADSSSEFIHDFIAFQLHDLVFEGRVVEWDATRRFIYEKELKVLEAEIPYLSDQIYVETNRIRGRREPEPSEYQELYELEQALEERKESLKNFAPLKNLEEDKKAFLARVASFRAQMFSSSRTLDIYLEEEMKLVETLRQEVARFPSGSKLIREAFPNI